MRITQAWNKNWEYVDVCTDKFINGEADAATATVELPHSNSIVPHNYFDESIYQKLCAYRKRFDVPEAWRGKMVRIIFEGAAHEATLYLNGQIITQHKGGYTAFEADLSDALRYGESNLISVKLDSRESLNMPPFGAVIDYMTFGGLYRAVSLQITEAEYIKDVFAHMPIASTKPQLQIQTTLSLLANDISGFLLQYRVLDGDEVLCQQRQTVDSVSMQTGPFTVPHAQLWELANPKLYTLRTSLYKGAELIDETDTIFGLRTAKFETDGFYLNGEKVKIRGLNRHQSYPSVGYAMPQRPQQMDADICKYELGLNAVRTSHYPQSKHFLRRCDEIGLLVFTEMPGWQHIGGDEWKKIACEHVGEMVLQCRNHPSIVLWGVRINESQDDDVFYEETNRIAHDLDPSRQTGGVRYIKKSSLLEDVYCYNDFSHNGTNAPVEARNHVTPNMGKPYLICEYNGHMFPTKAFDWEGKRLEHALRHARVVNGYYGYDDISGGFGWCMFDYHTHQDFGSGDRVCYHGVMDMYRNEKLAAAVYKSQADGETTLEISSSMDIGEHPVGNLGTVYAFTNADSVRLYKNNDFVKEFFPDKKNFPNMPHAPIAIDDFVGGLLEEKEGLDHKTSEVIKELMMAVATVGLSNLSLLQKLKVLYYMKTRNLSFDECYRLFGIYMQNWGGEATCYRFDAIKNGVVEKNLIKETVKSTALYAAADTQILFCSGDTYDVATLRIHAVDQNGNTLAYCMENVELSVTGPLEIIGPKNISLKGGLGGTYLKTTGSTGIAKLTLNGGYVGCTELEFEIR